MAKVTVVAGAQFGSEGKGAVAGRLGRDMVDSDLAIRVAGPNAGHTAYDDNGTEWKLRALPVAAVTSRTCELHVAAGSEVDINVLDSEISAVEEAGIPVRGRLTIHPSATMLTQTHISSEGASGLVGRIGSTGKGIGAARSARIWREATTFGGYARHLPGWEGLIGIPQIGNFDDVVIEGTQGYGLGLHTEYYPQVTSSDCRAIDFLSMAGISPWSLDVEAFRVILVARVYPIRVAGESGPLRDETTWEGLGLPVERTTVTNKVRRVGAWDQQLVKDAIEANGGGDMNPRVTLAITMLDQKFPELRDKEELTIPARDYLRGLEDELGCWVTMAGTGPNTMIEL